MLDDNAPDAKTYMDCDECKLDDGARAYMQCGWVPERKRNSRGRALIPAEYPHKPPSVCGGYLVRLPMVIDAARANNWREKGCLREYFDGDALTEIAKDAIDIIASANQEVSNYNIRQAGEK